MSTFGRYRPPPSSLVVDDTRATTAALLPPPSLNSVATPDNIVAAVHSMSGRPDVINPVTYRRSDSDMAISSPPKRVISTSSARRRSVLPPPDECDDDIDLDDGISRSTPPVV